MKLFRLLRRPDWEHKDAAVRLAAVRSSQEPALLALLPELAQRDPAAEVRAAALGRIDDLSLLARRLRGENEAAVAAAARDRLAQLLCGGAQPLDARLTALREVHDAELLREVAQRGNDSALRQAALERINSPGFLFERCLNDPDRRLRLWLLERIEAPEALQRLVQAARARDKTLARAARDKLDALQRAAGDPAALRRRVLALCDALDKLSRELPADAEQRVAALRAEWDGLAGAADAELQRRATAFLQLAEQALAAARGELTPVAVPAPAAQIEAAMDTDESEPPAADVATSTSAATPDVSPEPAVPSTPSEPPVTAADRAAINAALDALDAALDEGSLQGAREAQARLQGQPLAKGQASRLAAAERRIAELAQWQRWSSHELRQRLCEQVEALIGSGLHPDALANRVKELQTEWARLDPLEGGTKPGERGLEQRFRGLCRKALAPAQGYFDKRRQLQDERAAQNQALLAEAAALGEGADSAALVAMRRRLGEALRELHRLAPAQRGEQGRALRERIAAIDTALAALREQAALAKRRLLAKLRRDLGQTQGAAAVALAREAQAEFKRLPRAEREVEQTLRDELRALVDPLFAGEREAAQRQQAQTAERQAAAQALIDEARQLAAADSERLLHAEAQIDGLKQRWQALQPAAEPRGERRERREMRAELPEAAFQAALADLADARQRALRERRQQALAALGRAGALLDRYRDSGDPAARAELRDAFIALPLATDARAALQPRLVAIDAGNEPASSDGAAAEALAVRAELIAGIESPADSAALRRQEQMRRLAERLEGAASVAPADEIRALLLALQAEPGLQPERREALTARVLRAGDAAGL